MVQFGVIQSHAHEPPNFSQTPIPPSRINVPHPSPACSYLSSAFYTLVKYLLKAGSTAQVTEGLPSNLEVLSSNPCTTKKNFKEILIVIKWIIRC
jgi:hypothetical protein